MKNQYKQSQKGLLYSKLKLAYKVFQRKIKDIFSSQSFAKKSNHTFTGIYTIKLKQSFAIANRMYNLQIACKEIERTTIQPGQVFSFWRIVGKPAKNKGYKTIVNLVNNQLQNDIYTGLNQLAGIIYHLSLIAGLQVLERYNHSLDPYTEEERFTPLGADATVVYGYKDLRIKNNHTFPIAFTFNISSDSLECILLSKEEITPQKVEFKRTDYKKRKEVFTRINRRTIDISVYKNPKG